MFPHVAIGA